MKFEGEFKNGRVEGHGTFLSYPALISCGFSFSSGTVIKY